MKTLKITLIVAVLFASFTSCTKQELNEDEVLTTDYYAGNIDEENGGGGGHDGDGGGD